MKVFTVKMEILLEPTSNKLLVGTISVLQPRSSEVEFINHMLILKLSKSIKDSSIGEIASFFWGGSGDRKKMVRIKWGNVMASLDKGVLAIHGIDAGMDGKGCKTKGVWEKIVGSYSQLHERDIIPIFTLRHKVGCGSSVRF
nr:hypothetical protein [Tanacetum cinerariifolium]